MQEEHNTPAPTRVCGYCKRSLTLDNYFNYKKDLIYGKGHTCKECNRHILKEWRAKNRDKVAVSNKRRHDAGKKNLKAGKRFCKTCGADLVGKSYKAIYCSIRCHNAELYKDNRITCECTYCGSSIVLPASRKYRDNKESVNLFCSKHCSTQYWADLRALDSLAEKDRRARGSLEVQAWRKAVFARDDYTCQDCGSRGGRLQAHHIKRWKHYPELRTVLENGVTLCKKCHLVYTRRELSKAAA